PAMTPPYALRAVKATLLSAVAVVTLTAAAVSADGLEGGTIFTGAGPGGTPEVKAFDSQGLAPQQDFLAYSIAFTGGVSVATGFLNGAPVIVTGAGPGGSPHVKVFDAATLAVQQSFVAFDPSLTYSICRMQYRLAQCSPLTASPCRPS